MTSVMWLEPPDHPKTLPCLLSSYVWQLAPGSSSSLGTESPLELFPSRSYTLLPPSLSVPQAQSGGMPGQEHKEIYKRRDLATHHSATSKPGVPPAHPLLHPQPNNLVRD